MAGILPLRSSLHRYRDNHKALFPSSTKGQQFRWPHQEEEEKMKTPITTQQELNRMSVNELHGLFNRAAGIAFSSESIEPEKAVAKASLEQIKRVLTSRRP